MRRYRGSICPRIQQVLEKNKRDAEGWAPNWVGDDGYSLFEVRRDPDKYVVNLSERSCSCRKWDLTGIPCCHGVACMWHNNYAPEDYVSIHYRCCVYSPFIVGIVCILLHYWIHIFLLFILQKKYFFGYVLTHYQAIQWAQVMACVRL